MLIFFAKMFVFFMFFLTSKEFYISPQYQQKKYVAKCEVAILQFFYLFHAQPHTDNFFTTMNIVFLYTIPEKNDGRKKKKHIVCLKYYIISVVFFVKVFNSFLKNCSLFLLCDIFYKVMILGGKV